MSFIIPIGGTGRRLQFDLALAAARAQRNVQCEIMVVEQSPEPALGATLPPDVRYLHQHAAAPESPFNKSAALNAGAAAARGLHLIVLDADYMVPVDFARQCSDVLQGCDAVRPARLVFYLDETTTLALRVSGRMEASLGLESIVANNPTPIALRAESYWAIGGHDESYVGWGGEDCEFLERLRTLNVCEGGWLPVLHAWHAPAAQKASGHRNRELHAQRLSLNVAERISRLKDAKRDRKTVA